MGACARPGPEVDWPVSHGAALPLLQPLIPLIGFMLLVERFLDADVLAMVGR